VLVIICVSFCLVSSWFSHVMVMPSIVVNALFRYMALSLVVLWKMNTSWMQHFQFQGCNSSSVLSRYSIHPIVEAVRSVVLFIGLNL